MEPRTGAWPQRPSRGPSTGFTPQQGHGQAPCTPPPQAGAASSLGRAPGGLFPMVVSRQWAALKSSGLFDMFIEEPKPVLLVMASHPHGRPALLSLPRRPPPRPRGSRAAVLTHLRVSSTQTRVLFQLLPEAGRPRGHREIQPGPGFPHAQLRQDGPDPPGDRRPGP